MTFATSLGWDNMATWLEGRTVVVALICLAMLFSCSGAIILSLLATMYHDGLLCQPAAVGFAPRMEPAVCGWTATRRAFSSFVKSWANAVSIPSGDSRRKPSDSGVSFERPRGGERLANLRDGLVCIRSESGDVD